MLFLVYAAKVTSRGEVAGRSIECNSVSRPVTNSKKFLDSYAGKCESSYLFDSRGYYWYFVGSPETGPDRPFASM